MSQSDSASRKRLRDETEDYNTTTSKSSRSNPYSAKFRQRLIDRGVFPPDYYFPDGRSPEPPENFKEIRDHLGRRRASLSLSQFSETAFINFRRALHDKAPEASSSAMVISTIAGEKDREKRYRSAGGVYFNNLDPIGSDISRPKPDHYDGAPPETIHEQIRQDLSAFIVPSADDSLPAAPNFFGEWKSSKGKFEVAKQQACNNGACGARGMNQLQNYQVDDQTYDNRAYTLTTAFSSSTGSLHIYAVHPTAPGETAGGLPTYRTSLLDSFFVDGPRREKFLEAAAAYRNARDWCATQRQRLIENANRRVAERRENETQGALPTPSQSDAT